MDLLAPNPEIMRTGFIQLGLIVVMTLVAAIKRSTTTGGASFGAKLAFWAKMNAPLVSIVIGELWAVAAWFLFRVVPAIDDYFIVGLWLAGGSSLASAIMKDAGDGSYKATSPDDVQKMRAENPSKGGIGS